MTLKEYPQPPIVEFANIPQTLNDARLAVLNLPGIGYYVPDAKVSLVEIDKGLDQMVEAVIKQLDAENMMVFTTNWIGWSENEAEEFFSHPERQPYQSQIEFLPDLQTRLEQFLTIGTYLRLKYEEARTQRGMTSEVTQQTGENLAIFYEFSMYNLFMPFALDHTDRVNGINPEDRHAGTIHPTREILSLMKEETTKIATAENVNPDELYTKVLEATEGGNFATIRTFLLNKRGEAALRRTLEAIIMQRANDQSLAIEKIQLVWMIEVYRMAMGIDLEMFYEINQFPNGQTIEARLHEFLTKQAYVDETWQHLRTEAARVVADAESTRRPMNYWAILETRADFHHFSDKVSTRKELENRKQLAWLELASTLPLAFVETPTSFIDAPARMGANPRAVNITYPNTNDQLVNIIILNPRDRLEHFKEVTGHELGHRLHALMLKIAETAGYVSSWSWNRVPESVKEEFSQLVENQVGKTTGEQALDPVVDEAEIAQMPRDHGEWRDLYHAIKIRHQAPYALIQRAVRLEMEVLWRSGQRSWILPVESAWAIIEKVNPQVSIWHGEGVPIEFPGQTVMTNVDILDPTDGLVYLRKYLIDAPNAPQVEEEAGDEKKEEPTKQATDMKTAFEQRFGNKWLLNKDARVVLLALLAETGNNYDITTYGRFVLDADVEEVKNKLLNWGITENLI